MPKDKRNLLYCLSKPQLIKKQDDLLATLESLSKPSLINAVKVDVTDKTDPKSAQNLNAKE